MRIIAGTPTALHSSLSKELGVLHEAGEVRRDELANQKRVDGPFPSCLSSQI